jgi:hypothetical protein
MRKTWTSIGIVLSSVVALGSCKRADGTTTGDLGSHGRYTGVGIYTPSVAWTKIAQDQQPRSALAAKLVDDEAIIVVTDSQTGEIRACGDLSGYCVGMNPWQAGLAKSQLAPVSVTQHGNPQSYVETNSADNEAAPATSDNQGR